MPLQVVTLPRAWLPLIAGIAVFALLPSVQSAAQQAQTGQLHFLQVRGNIYVLQGAGANITVSIGRDGVLLVDSGLQSMGEQVLAAIRHLQSELDLRDTPIGFGAETRSSVADRNITRPVKPIRYIINTNVHPDHVGANERLRRSGMTFTGGNVTGNISDATEGAAIMAHEAVLPDHVLEDPRQLAHLVSTCRLYGCRQISLVNLPSGKSQPSERRNDVPGQEKTHCNPA